MITILVAMDDNRVIGNKGNLPWRNPEDLRVFEKRTLGGAVIMGRKTWESIPNRPLHHRRNIVVSRTMPVPEEPRYWVARSLEEAIERAKGVTQESGKVFIIGGAQIYREAIQKDLADRILVSKIPGEHTGDVLFPELDKEWLVNLAESHKTFNVWEYAK